MRKLIRLLSVMYSLSEEKAQALLQATRDGDDKRCFDIVPRLRRETAKPVPYAVARRHWYRDILWDGGYRVFVETDQGWRYVGRNADGKPFITAAYPGVFTRKEALTVAQAYREQGYPARVEKRRPIRNKLLALLNTADEYDASLMRFLESNCLHRLDRQYKYLHDMTPTEANLVSVVLLIALAWRAGYLNLTRAGEMVHAAAQEANLMSMEQAFDIALSALQEPGYIEQALGMPYKK